MGINIASKMALAGFIFFLLLTLFTLGFSVINVTDPDYNVETYVTESGTRVTISHGSSMPLSVLFTCNSVFVILTILTFFYWRHRKKYDRIMEELPSYLELYRRIKLEEVAQRLGITMKELDIAFRKCVKKGTIQGSIDDSTGEFVLLGVKYHKVSMSCSNCGAFVEKKFLEGEIIKCEYCGVNL